MRKTLIKTVSWALVSGVLIFGSAYSATGLVRESLLAACFASLLKTPVYAAHEPLFERIYKRFTKGQNESREHQPGDC